ncbi:hypothetical protein [Streptosporangium sp. NPDC049078]|uniref:hypothetical protein n=1 Tax=Streptosporangium sp. NPDC049078 TaxID=3155767 RepID=UPI00341B52A2
MSERETTTAHLLGWPRTGELTVRDGRPQIAIDYGSGLRDWADDAAYARAVASAWSTAARVLETEADRRIVDGLGPEPVERPAAPGETTTFPVLGEEPDPAPELVPATPATNLPQGVAPFGVPCPKGCRHLVYPGQNGPVHLVQGGTAAACPPPSDDDPAPTRVFDAPILDAS